MQGCLQTNWCGTADSTLPTPVTGGHEGPRLGNRHANTNWTGMGRHADTNWTGMGRHADTNWTGMGRHADTNWTGMGRHADTNWTGMGRHADTNWTGMSRDRCIWGESKHVWCLALLVG